jgi:hypothetical protein
MSATVDLGQRLELRDASGSVLGYFLPLKELVQSRGDRPDSQHCQTQGQAGIETSESLVAERDRLLQEVALLRAERDLYLESLYVLTREDFTYDKQAILANLNSGQTLEQLLEELEAVKGA